MADPGAILWTPALIDTGLWLDGSDASTVNDTTRYWNDKSGDGRNFRQFSATYWPTYTLAAQNGLNVMRFDGANDFLAPGVVAASNLFRNVPGGAVFIAMRRTGGASTGALFWCSTAHTGTVYQRVVIEVTSAQNRFHHRRLDSDATRLLTVSRSGEVGVVSAVFDFSAGTASVGNTGTYATGSTSSSGGNSTDAASTSFMIGSFNGSVYQLAGDIMEIVALQSAPDAATVQRIDGYLAWKWGMQTLLPSSHPFRYSPPVVGVVAPSVALPLAYAVPWCRGSNRVAGLPISYALGVPTAFAPIPLPPDFRAGGRRIYTLTISGDPLLSLPMASLQCRRRLGASTWLTASVPSWSAAMESDLRSRIGGQISVDAGNGVQSGAFLSATLTDVGAEYGPMGATLTLAGRVQTPSYTRQTRALFGVRSLSDDSGRRGCVCDVDPLLRPNDTVDDGESEWIAGSIDYRIGPFGASMTVTEANG